jgi:hypothetical protein
MGIKLFRVLTIVSEIWGPETQVGGGLAPEVMALIFVDHDDHDLRGVNGIYLKSPGHLKHWQIFQQGSEIGYFSASVSAETEIFEQDAAHLLKKFDISACR